MTGRLLPRATGKGPPLLYVDPGTDFQKHAANVAVHAGWRLNPPTSRVHVYRAGVTLQ